MVTLTIGYGVKDLCDVLKGSLKTHVDITYNLDIKIVVNIYTDFQNETFTLVMLAYDYTNREVSQEISISDLREDPREATRTTYKEFKKYLEMWYSGKSYWNC